MSLAEYLEMERKMISERQLHPEGSTLEEHIMDVMDVLWHGLTDDDRAKLESLPSEDLRVG